MSFEWSEAKNLENTTKHGLSFYEAQEAFLTTKELFCLTRNILRSRQDIFVSEKRLEVVLPLFDLQ